MPFAVVVCSGDLGQLFPLVDSTEVSWDGWELLFREAPSWGESSDQLPLEELGDVRVLLVLHDLTTPIDRDRLSLELKSIPDTHETLRVILVGTNYDAWRKLNMVVRIQREWRRHYGLRKNCFLTDSYDERLATEKALNFTTLQQAKQVCCSHCAK